MEILRIHINILEENRLDTEERTINMVLFGGFCEGDFFTGKVLNGGVDTQIYEKDGSGTLSARYLLAGKDNKNEDCCIFIENNGVTGTADMVTSPRLYTNSSSLKWLENTPLSGRILMEKDQLVISIFTGGTEDGVFIPV